MKKSELPQYAMLKGTEMRLTDKHGEKQYWRDAGLWGVKFRIKGDKVFAWCKSIAPHLHNVELIPITEEEWRNGNEGYI